MYSQDKIDIALQVYHQCGYVTNTICMLGYPTRRALYTCIKYVSEEIGCSRAGIYAWRKKYLQGGTVALMNDKNIKPGILAEGTRNSP